MAQVGQTTPTGGREWALHPTLGACRPVTVPVGCTLNHIGCYLREQNNANANNVLAAIYTSAGVLVYETAVLTAAITSTVTFAWYQLTFSGQSIGAGSYVLAASGSGTDGNVVIQGSNDSAGLVTYIAGDDPPTLYPSFPADGSTAFRTDASRQWDMYLDYTEATSGGRVVLAQLQSHGDCFL